MVNTIKCLAKFQEQRKYNIASLYAYTSTSRNIYHDVSNTVCFKKFSVKCKENDLLRKYMFFGGPVENASSPTVSSIEQNL